MKLESRCLYSSNISPRPFWKQQTCYNKSLDYITKVRFGLILLKAKELARISLFFFFSHSFVYYVWISWRRYLKVSTYVWFISNGVKISFCSFECFGCEQEDNYLLQMLNFTCLHNMCLGWYTRFKVPEKSSLLIESPINMTFKTSYIKTYLNLFLLTP